MKAELEGIEYTQVDGAQPHPRWERAGRDGPCTPAEMKEVGDPYKDVCFTAEETLGKLILDSGCKFSVAGSSWHRAMETTLKKYGLQPQPSIFIDEEGREYREDPGSFRFGDGKVIPGVQVLWYPLGVFGRNIHVPIAEVACECPPLMSIKAMRDLGLILNFKADTTTIGEVTRKMTKMASGHPCVRVDEYDYDQMYDDFRLGSSRWPRAPGAGYQVDTPPSEGEGSPHWEAQATWLENQHKDASGNWLDIPPQQLHQDWEFGMKRRHKKSLRRTIEALAAEREGRSPPVLP